MELEEYSLSALNISGIPAYMHYGIINYYKNGWEPGGFLTALINNDLKETLARADDAKTHHIKDYMMWFYNYAPSGTWGYTNAVGDYIARLQKEQEDATRKE